MRKRKFRIVHVQSAKVYEVNVYGSGPVEDCPHAAERVLYRVHATLEFPRLKSSLKHNDLIKELKVCKLLGHINRLRLFHGALRDEPSRRHCRKHLKSAGQIFGPWLYVRAKRHDRSNWLHHLPTFNTLKPILIRASRFRQLRVSNTSAGLRIELWMRCQSSEG